MTNLKALVLDAGKGTRLQTEGIDLPKVMRLADGKPLLHYVLIGQTLWATAQPEQRFCSTGKEATK